MTCYEHEIYARAINLWGVSAQFCQAMEECAELIVAVNKQMRHHDNINNIIEEMADVSIMIDQIRMMVGCSEAEFDIIKNMKVRSLEGAVIIMEGRKSRGDEPFDKPSALEAKP